MTKRLQDRIDIVANGLEDAGESTRHLAGLLDVAANTLEAASAQAPGDHGMLSTLMEDIGKARAFVSKAIDDFDLKCLSALPEVLGGDSADVRARKVLELYQKPSASANVEELDILTDILLSGYQEAGIRMQHTETQSDMEELFALRKKVEDWTSKAAKVRKIWEAHGVSR